MSDNMTATILQMQFFICFPENTIAHNTALKLNNPILMSSTGAENINAIIADMIAPASPYNAEIGELISTPIKNRIPEIMLPWKITCPYPLNPTVK